MNEIIRYALASKTREYAVEQRSESYEPQIGLFICFLTFFGLKPKVNMFIVDAVAALVALFFRRIESPEETHWDEALVDVRCKGCGSEATSLEINISQDPSHSDIEHHVRIRKCSSCSIQYGVSHERKSQRLHLSAF